MTLSLELAKFEFIWKICWAKWCWNLTSTWLYEPLACIPRVSKIWI